LILYLKLEITESVRRKCGNLHLPLVASLGIRLFIDDFGTGYSSLSYLHQLPIDTLKIDGLINKVDVNVEKSKLSSTIVAICFWNLGGMAVVAEGVETNKQMHQVKALK